VAQHPQLGGNELELLGDLLADALERGAVLRTDLLLVRQVVEDLDAGNPVRQRLASPLLAPVRFDEDGGVFLFAGVLGRALGLVEQADLLVAALLALPTEAMVLEQADVLTQCPKLTGQCIDERLLLVEQLGLHVKLVLLSKRELTECFGIVGKLDRSDRHDDLHRTGNFGIYKTVSKEISSCGCIANTSMPSNSQLSSRPLSVTTSSSPESGQAKRFFSSRLYQSTKPVRSQ
jgi:hypothetical protein